MAQVVINGITFGSVRAKSTGTGIGDILVQSNVNGRKLSAYVESEDFYALVNAIDIDWNGAVVDENVVLHSTADLIAWIQSKASQLELELATDEDIEALFENDGGGTGYQEVTDPGGEVIIEYPESGYASDDDITALFG